MNATPDSMTHADPGQSRAYAVYSGDVLVGHSMLEHGDPPMGVAFGEFLPGAGYSAIQRECTSNHTDQTHLALEVRTSSGIKLICAGVVIHDYSEKMGEPYSELHALGISHPPYEELFPQHIAAYDERLRSA